MADVNGVSAFITLQAVLHQARAPLGRHPDLDDGRPAIQRPSRP
jgi:hypothetical protein